MTFRRFLSLLFLCGFTTILSAQSVTPNLYRDADKQAMTHWVDSVFESLTEDQKVGQLFMPIVESTPAWRTRVSGYIRNQHVGGLLFSKGTLAQQAEATNYAQRLADVPLMISLDGEWGLSMRLTDAPKYPRNQLLGAIQDKSILELYGAEVARQCRLMGIHVNFAPSVDVHTNPANPIIGTRSFGENAERVAWQSIAYAKGLESGRVMAVAKHFPGHGDTSDDSHLTLPTIKHNKERLEAVELLPFREYIKAGLSGIMIGHLNVPALQTKGMPSSLTPAVGVDLLQKDMGFTGLAFTDGMAMKGVSKHADATVKALLAGSDVIVGGGQIENQVASVKRALKNGTLPKSLFEEKVRKVLTYKYILGVHLQKPIATASISRNVNNEQSKWVLRKLYDGMMTWVKNDADLAPIKQLNEHRISSVSIGGQSSSTFQSYLKKYAKVTTFHASSVSAIPTDKLKEFDMVIFSVHAPNISESSALQQVMADKNSVLVLFASPYRLSAFKTSTSRAKSVLVAYDNSPEAQMSAAQAVFGGIDVTGKLPVSAGGFNANEGIDTPKTRLAYSLPEEVGLSSTYLQSIDRIAQEGVRQKAYPGAYVLVAKDGVVVYEKGFGRFTYEASSSAVTDETVYDLASVTKATATLPAVMKLYDTQQLKLTDAISKYVPETKGSGKANANIRSLLLHESGITSYIPYYKSAIDENSFSGNLFGSRSATYNAFYAGAWGRTDYRFLPLLVAKTESERFAYPIAKGLYASDDMKKKLLKDVIDSKMHNRGRYVYSCLNFMLLKEAVEHIAQTDLNSYLHREFYDKLGATSTTYLPLEQMSIDVIPPTENDPFFRQQQVRGYVHDEGAALFGGISGNAGLFSNANDMAKLYQMWLNGGEYGGERYLSEATVRMFTTTKSGHSRRGLGFDKPDPHNTKRSPTSPGTPIEVYGHTGFTGTCFWIDPTNNLIYIFLSNRVYPSRTPNRLSSLEIRERIQQQIYNALSASNK